MACQAPGAWLPLLSDLILSHSPCSVQSWPSPLLWMLQVSFCPLVPALTICLECPPLDFCVVRTFLPWTVSLKIAFLGDTYLTNPCKADPPIVPYFILFIVLISISMFLVYVTCSSSIVSCPPKRMLLWLSPYPSGLEKCLRYSRSSINICWIFEWINAFPESCLLRSPS